jgi:hypothetical protein
MPANSANKQAPNFKLRIILNSTSWLLRASAFLRQGWRKKNSKEFAALRHGALREMRQKNCRLPEGRRHKYRGLYPAFYPCPHPGLQA